MISGLATTLYALLPSWIGKELPLVQGRTNYRRRFGASWSYSDHTIVKENIMKVLQTSTLAVVFWGLSMGAVGDPDKPRVFQTSPVFNGENMEEIGAAWLQRSENRVDGRIMTTVGTAGIPYTVWWVIFNNPAGCNGPCGPDSFADGGEAAEIAVFNASGVISGVDGMSDGGIINLDLSVIGGEGAGIGSQVPPPPATNAPPWNRVLRENNARCAEIHLDINQHPELDDAIDWVKELTYPEGPHSFAVFKPPADCENPQPACPAGYLACTYD